MRTHSSSFNLAVCPRRAFYVRKRRTGAHVYLIHIAKLYRIDDLGEAIWNLCDGETPVTDMLARLAPLFPQTNGIELLQAVVRSLLFMSQQALIEPWDAPVLPPALDYAEFNKPLAALMQTSHHEAALPWEKELTRKTAEKVQNRFYRICYEAYWAAAPDRRRVLNERAFRNRWAERFLLDADIVARAFADQFDVKRWRFSPAENRIIMVRGGSVYEGDVDNRL